MKSTFHQIPENEEICWSSYVEIWMDLSQLIMSVLGVKGLPSGPAGVQVPTTQTPVVAGCVPPLARLVVEVNQFPGIPDTFQRKWMLVSPVGVWRVPPATLSVSTLIRLFTENPPGHFLSIPQRLLPGSPSPPPAAASITDSPLHLWIILPALPAHLKLTYPEITLVKSTIITCLQDTQTRFICLWIQPSSLIPVDRRCLCLQAVLLSQ